MECHTLNDNLLFFSYGAVHYRPHEFQTENVSEAPVAFIFNADLLDKIQYIFPYDTGIIGHADTYLSGFPAEWRSELSRFDRYRIEHDTDGVLLRKLIVHIYGSNRKYIDGEAFQVDLEGQIPSGKAISQIRDFLRADLADTGIDSRHRTIECQAVSSVGLLDSLVWVGMPFAHFPTYNRICKLRTPPHIVEPFFYPLTKNFSPAKRAEVLMDEARKRVFEKYLNFEQEEGDD
jgi:hypothetical protein